MALKYGADGYPLIFSAVSDGVVVGEQVVRMSLHADALDGYDMGRGPGGLPRVVWDYVEFIHKPRECWLTSCRSEKSGGFTLRGPHENGLFVGCHRSKGFTDTNDAAVRWLLQDTSDPRRKKR